MVEQNIWQSKMSEKYKSHYTSTFLMSVMSSVISIAFALSFERDWNQWRLGWNVRLLAVAYAVTLGSDFAFFVRRSASLCAVPAGMRSI